MEILIIFIIFGVISLLFVAYQLHKERQYAEEMLRQAILLKREALHEQHWKSLEAQKVDDEKAK